ncbi:MAG: translation elongation factor Ts [Nitrospirae bacterium]|nr:translation elongation factor Ts [Nitrospirota bacterium]
MIDASLIKELREKTGAGIIDCKNAIVKANGDLNKAVDLLRIKGAGIAEKKAGRTTSEGIIGSYIHHDEKIGVMIEVNCETDFVARNEEFKGFVKDLAMQIAGANPPPVYVKTEDIPPEVIEKEKEIYSAQARESGKPEAVIQKIAEGKIEKFYSERCLLEQPFIKNPDFKIKDLLVQRISKVGENISVRRFIRFKVGE